MVTGPVVRESLAMAALLSAGSSEARHSSTLAARLIASAARLVMLTGDNIHPHASSSSRSCAGSGSSASGPTVRRPPGPAGQSTLPGRAGHPRRAPTPHQTLIPACPRTARPCHHATTTQTTTSPRGDQGVLVEDRQPGQRPRRATERRSPSRRALRARPQASSCAPPNRRSGRGSAP